MRGRGNNRKILTITQLLIFKWRFRHRTCFSFLNSLIAWLLAGICFVLPFAQSWFSRAMESTQKCWTKSSESQTDRNEIRISTPSLANKWKKRSSKNDVSAWKIMFAQLWPFYDFSILLAFYNVGKVSCKWTGKSDRCRCPCWTSAQENKFVNVVS